MLAYYRCVAYLWKRYDIIDTCKALYVSEFGSDWRVSNAKVVIEADVEREHQIEILVGMAWGKDYEIFGALGHEEI